MAKGFEEEQSSVYVPGPGPGGDRERAGADEPRVKLKVGPGGRVVIPAAMREALGVEEGSVLVAHVDSGELRLMSLNESVRRAQTLVRQVVPAGVSLVDQLIQERRAEVEREEREG